MKKSLLVALTLIASTAYARIDRESWDSTPPEPEPIPTDPYFTVRFSALDFHTIESHRLQLNAFTQELKVLQKRLDQDICERLGQCELDAPDSGADSLARPSATQVQRVMEALRKASVSSAAPTAPATPPAPGAPSVDPFGDSLADALLNLRADRDRFELSDPRLHDFDLIHRERNDKKKVNRKGHLTNRYGNWDMPAIRIDYANDSRKQTQLVLQRYRNIREILDEKFPRSEAAERRYAREFPSGLRDRMSLPISYHFHRTMKDQQRFELHFLDLKGRENVTVSVSRALRLADFVGGGASLLDPARIEFHAQGPATLESFAAKRRELGPQYGKRWVDEYLQRTQAALNYKSSESKKLHETKIYSSGQTTKAYIERNLSVLYALETFEDAVLLHEKTLRDVANAFTGIERSLRNEGEDFAREKSAATTQILTYSDDVVRTFRTTLIQQMVRAGISDEESARLLSEFDGDPQRYLNLATAD